MRNVHYLRVLKQYPQASDKELAELFSTTPRYANVILQRLKRKGLINITHKDGRIVKLTREAEQLLSLETESNKLVEQLDRLISQLRQLNRNLKHLLKSN